MSESPARIRVLLLADSHLGFDLPTRPRVDRRRRGHDFLANHIKALGPALEGKIDLVVHGGDVFHRPLVPPSLVFQAFEPLLEIAEAGIPVFVVPGNHERSRIPHQRFAAHPNLHVFQNPGTVVVQVGRARIALSGFPYRRHIRGRFPEVLEETGWRRENADIRLLCIHHCVEGATVGPSDYTFRHAKDVIRCADLPAEFAAVLSGHIHRHQVLLKDLWGRPLSTPVLYPGSVERTAFAEMGEEKGFMELELEPYGEGGRLVHREFLSLSARPMLERELRPAKGLQTSWSHHELESQLISSLSGVPRDAVLRVRVHGPVGPDLRPTLSAPNLRRLSPPEMNLDVILTHEGGNQGSRRRLPRGPTTHRTSQAAQTHPSLFP